MSSDVKRLGDRIWNIGDTWLYGPVRRREYREVFLPFLLYQRWWCNAGAPAQSLIHCQTVEDLMQSVRESPIADLLLRLKIEQQGKRLAKANRLADFLQAIAQLKIGSSQEPFSIGELYQFFLSKNPKAAVEDGAYYTPPDVAKLMATLLFTGNPPVEDRVQIYDPACGMCDLLFAAAEVFSEAFPGKNKHLHLQLLGQEIDPFTHAIAQAEMWLNHASPEDIKCGDTLAADRFPFLRPRYILANPPFGVNWSAARPAVQEELKTFGPRSRWSHGISRVNDGQLMFLQHIAKKLHPDGGRAVVLTNASPSFIGQAGSGDGNIRKWLIESGLLDTVIALPENLFFNTPIATQLWILDSHHSPRKGKFQIINAARLLSQS